MGDQEELSDEEYDALLADLEGRAAEGGGGDVEMDDDQDLEEFLGSIEADAEAKSKTKVAQREDDGLEAAFADLEEKGEMTAPKKKKKKKKKEKKGEKGAQKEAGKKGEEGSGRGKAIALMVAKNALWVVPAVLMWWVVGVYLGFWVSAGWLIALVATAAVLGIPRMLYKATGKANYRVWVGGLAVAMLVALIAPMTERAGTAMGFYGHWPATAVAEVVGAESDAGFVETQGRMGGWLGSQISGEQAASARQLGTVFPLGFALPEEVLMDAIEGAEGGVDEVEGLLEDMVQDAQEVGEGLQDAVEGD